MTSSPISQLLVLGSGSAGLIAALTLKIKMPQLTVTVLRSPSIGIIGVGEGTTPNFPHHLFEFVGLNRKHFWDIAKPTWKLGIRFLWGPRGQFDYTFDKQLDTQLAGLEMPNAFYCDDDFTDASLPAALMARGKVFSRQADGAPAIEGWHAMHIENDNLVRYLELAAKDVGIDFIDGTVQSAERAPDGPLAAVYLDDGRRVAADFFVDASGFRSELLGKALGEAFVSFSDSLFCDRAVAGGWERTDEPILPYTTAETMDAGWAWQIEHEHHINRGYVFSSAHLSDDEAAAEFCRKNPKAPREPRLIKFRSGHYRRQWVENVVAIGNAGGFVEPLEATALMIVCGNVQLLTEMLQRSQLEPTASLRAVFNQNTQLSWEDIRDFLALHYKLNTRLQTPFWKHAQAETNVQNIEPLLDFYKENGPTGFGRFLLNGNRSDFGLEGYLVMLVGNKAPSAFAPRLSPAQRAHWKAHQQNFGRMAESGMTVKEALAYVHHPQWSWLGDS
jgi:tryptophan 7-halogenase